MSIRNNEKTGCILMSYGSATTAEGVSEYFKHIYKGRASPAVIQDFENRYRLVGHSPLIEITAAQSSLLQEELGDAYVVRSGMRHSTPFIQDAIHECRRRGATSLVGVILSPQFSSFIMEGYKTDFTKAALQHGFDAHHAALARPWGTEVHFIELLINRVRKALKELRTKYGASVPVIFTTHSLPLRVVEKDSNYIQQLHATINAVLKGLLPNQRWYAGYQSAGHTQEEWLKPDLVEILARLHTEGVKAVVLVPIQFLSDHLEVLYDLDIAAKKQCDRHHIAYHRIALPNTEPLFIHALAAVTRNTEKSLG